MRLVNHRTGLDDGGAPDAGAGESGASLIMVLAFMIVFSTVIAALLGMIVTSNRTINTYRQDRALRYVADGALDVAVVNVQLDATLGDTADPEPCATLPIDASLGAAAYDGMPDTTFSFTPGSEIVVTCRRTPGAVTTSGYRDITFEVTCGMSGGGSGSDVTCTPGGGSSSVLGEARVRYDYDPGYPDPEKARVPKVISWVLHR